MILVDSSVWIDFFNGHEGLHVEKFYNLLGKEPIATGDLILVEVLQGFRSDSQFKLAKNSLELLPYYQLCSKEIAILSAEHYRFMRSKGITVRKTIDMVIATFCISNNIKLLHSDRDFLPMEEFMGLKTI